MTHGADAAVAARGAECRFGTAPRGGLPHLEAGSGVGAGLAHGFDRAVAPRTPGVAFGPAESWDSSGTSEAHGCVSRAPSPVSVLDVNYAPTLKKAPAAGFPVAPRWPTLGGPGGAGDDRPQDAAAEALVADAATAHVATLPRRSAATFSKSARFGLEEESKAVDDAPSGPSAEERSIADLIQFVRPRVQAPSFGKPPPPPQQEKRRRAREVEGGREAPHQRRDVTYGAVDRHVPGVAFRPPRRVTVEDQLRGHLEGLKQPCPGGYDGAESGLRATKRRPRAVCFARAERTKLEKEIPKPSAATDPKRLMEALAATRPRAQAATFRPLRHAPPPRAGGGGGADATPAAAAARGEGGFLEVNFTLTEPRARGGRWGAPPVAKKPRRGPLSEEAEEAEDVGEGTALALDVQHGLTSRRHPSWSFPKANARRREPRVEAPPLSELDVCLADRWVRPAGALGTIRFNLQAGRQGPEKRRHGPHRAEPGSYDVMQSLKYLYTHVPGPVFGLMSRRWEDGVTGSIVLGGEAALLELSSAVAFVRPSPPAYSFAPLPATRSRKPRLEEPPASELDVKYTLVKQALPSVGAAWNLERPRFAPAAEPEYRAEGGLYTPSHALVEMSTPGVVFGGGAEGQPGALREAADQPGMGDVLHLHVEGADVHVYRALPGGVPFDMHTGHCEPARVAASELTARIGLPSPRNDAPVRPRVVSVDLRGHGGGGRAQAIAGAGTSLPDEFQQRRGPGLYHRVQLFGLGARAADFARPQGRPSYERYGGDADGDRLVLGGVESAAAAVRARAAEAVFPRAERFPSAEADPHSALEYDPSLALTRPSWPAAVDFELQLPRTPFHAGALGEAGPLTDYDVRDDSALSHMPPRPVAPGVDFSTMLGRQAEEAPADLRAPLDVAAADGLRFRAPVPPLDFRHGEGHALKVPEPEGPLDFTGVLRPAVIRGEVRFAKQLDRYAREATTGGVAQATGDLDAGCYEPAPHGAAAARSAALDFERAPPRLLGRRGGERGGGDGDRLDLNPKPSAFPERADLPLSEQPFSKFRPVRRQEWLQKQEGGAGGRLTFMTESKYQKADAVVRRAAPAVDFASASGRGWAGGLKEAPREARAEGRAWAEREPMLRASPWVAPESWAPGKTDVLQAQKRRKAAIGRMMARLKPGDSRIRPGGGGSGEDGGDGGATSLPPPRE